MAARKVGGARASRVGALGFTVAALILTGLTALLLARVMSDSKYAAEPMTELVVAAEDIPAAEVITEAHLKLVKWPVSSVPEGAFTSSAGLLEGESRVPVSTVLEGEPILEARLASANAGTGMASLVPPELRGFPIPVDSWIAAARLVYPGATVDVVATMRDPVDRKPMTKMVLQQVRVLAVDGDIDIVGRNARRASEGNKVDGSGQKSVVTLLVTPDQAEVLGLSAREGQIDLMLRNAGDHGLVETLGVIPENLLGTEEEEMEGDDEVAKHSRPRRRRTRRLPSPEAAAAIASDQPSAPATTTTRTRSGTGNIKTIRLGAK